MEKNYKGLYNLIYHSQYHEEALTIATYLPVYLYKRHKEKILSLFTPHYQELAINCKWKNGLPLYKEEQELEDTITKKIIY